MRLLVDEIWHKSYNCPESAKHKVGIYLKKATQKVWINQEKRKELQSQAKWTIHMENGKEKQEEEAMN